MGTATMASNRFEREAEAILREFGYVALRRSGSKHLMFRHTKDRERPYIRVPSTPRNASESLVFIRLAAEKGTATHTPPGRETDMPRKATAGTKDAPMGEKLVSLASSYMVKKAKDRKNARERGHTGRSDMDMRWPEEISSWMRRCLDTYGSVWNSDLRAAADELDLDASKLSEARRRIQAASYRTPVMPRNAGMTGYVSKLPPNATFMGGRGTKRGAAAAAETVVHPAEPEQQVETVNGNQGRRLEQGGLTPDEHAEAEQRMVQGHRRAEQERQEILAARGGGEMQTVAGETNGNGKKQTTLEAMLELVREAALEETHALTDEDIRTLTGMQEMHRRHASEATAAAGQIGLLLKRVAPNAVEVAA